MQQGHPFAKHLCKEAESSAPFLASYSLEELFLIRVERGKGKQPPKKCLWELNIYTVRHLKVTSLVLLHRILKPCFFVVQSLSRVRLCNPGLQHTRPPCPSPSPGACSNSCPLSQWCHPTISSSVVPFSSCLQSFPASGSFLMSLAAAAAAAAKSLQSYPTLWPHRWQPTQLCSHWDSPGKNAGVGCHFLLQCTKVKSESEVAQSRPTSRDPMDCSLPGSSIHGILQARVLEWVAIAFSEWVLLVRH